MFKSRNLLVIGIVLVMLAAFMIPLASAQPAQQATETPEATATVSETPEATVTASETPEATLAATTVASPTITATTAPTATAVSTPSTLPTTGGSDNGATTLGLIVLAVGALMVVGGVGLVMSRRTS